jgi:general stress protein YciG
MNLKSLWLERLNKMSKQKRGFALMDKDKQRAIASKGGKAAHKKGTTHEWDKVSASIAGKKGGQATHRKDKDNAD